MQCTMVRSAFSVAYDLFQGLDQVNMEYIKEGWEEELGMGIAEDMWKESLRYINTCSLNARHCFIQFKLLHTVSVGQNLFSSNGKRWRQQLIKHG